jgi:methylmalonyl-CoA mutase cobalamin-binding subunit
MGIGVSLSPLASAVAVEGGLGIVSSACLDLLLSRRLQKELTTYQAVREELSIAKDRGGAVGINIMVAISKHYEDSVRAAIDAGVDVIISGGGLPLTLPAIKDPGGTALIPIVSSARALELICRKWERHGYRPDAAILEGPLAGGHLGFKFEEISLEENKLENLLPPVKETAAKYGNFPIIVAGGIFTREDILSFLHLGADGVQMGTRFLVTETRLALRAAFPDNTDSAHVYFRAARSQDTAMRQGVRPAQGQERRLPLSCHVIKPGLLLHLQWPLELGGLQHGIRRASVYGRNERLSCGQDTYGQRPHERAYRIHCSRVTTADNGQSESLHAIHGRIRVMHRAEKEVLCL